MLDLGLFLISNAIIKRKWEENGRIALSHVNGRDKAWLLFFACADLGCTTGGLSF